MAYDVSGESCIIYSTTAASALPMSNGPSFSTPTPIYLTNLAFSV
jgi:hypothetical protein